MRPDTKRTVPMAWGYAMRVGPSTPTTPTARRGAAVRGEDEGDVAPSPRPGSRLPMKTRTVPAPATPLISSAEVGAVLERREHAAELLAVGELGRGHHVEQAVAEQLLDRRRRRTRGAPHDALADAASSRVRVGGVEPLEAARGLAGR